MVISKIAIEPSELQEDVRLQAVVEHRPPKICPDDEWIPSEDQEDDDRVPTQEFPDDDKIPLEEEEGDGRTQLQAFIGDEDIPPNEKEGDEWIPIRKISDNDVSQSEH